MTDALGYLFYPGIFSLILWCNKDACKTEDFLKAGLLTIFEFGVMFGSWLLALHLHYGSWFLLFCNLGAAAVPALLLTTAGRNSCWRKAGIRGLCLLGGWGVFSFLLRFGLCLK